MFDQWEDFRGACVHEQIENELEGEAKEEDVGER